MSELVEHLDNGPTPRAVYDKAGDTLYITIEDVPATIGKELEHGVIVRYAKGRVVGVTILDRYRFNE